MTIPASAVRWTQTMDPSDLVDYQIDLSGTPSLLESGELIDDYTLTVLSEGVAVGFQIEEDPPYAPTLTTGNKITFWASVDIASRNNAAYTTGLDIPIELEITTTSTPARRKQRTFVIKVEHK